MKALIRFSNRGNNAHCWGKGCIIQQVPCRSLGACQKQWTPVWTKNVVCVCVCVSECVCVALACGYLKKKMALPGAWTMTTLSTLSLWKISDGRSSSPTRGSLAPLGEKARNRRRVSGGVGWEGNARLKFWKSRASRNLAQDISRDNGNLTQP